MELLRKLSCTRNAWLRMIWRDPKPLKRLRLVRRVALREGQPRTALAPAWRRRISALCRGLHCKMATVTGGSEQSLSQRTRR